MLNPSGFGKALFELAIAASEDFSRFGGHKCGNACCPSLYRKNRQQLSRKHLLEIDRNKNVVTILGGRLTDCLNIGQETISEIRELGLQANDPGRWFGEGDQVRKKEFFALISAQPEDPAAATRIAEGLWRGPGVHAFEIIAGNLATEIIPIIGVTEAEIRHIANHEDVQVRQDLLGRRLPISMTRLPQELSANKELEKLLVELGL